VSTEEKNEFSQYDGMSLVELVHAMATLQNRKEATEDQLKLINKEYDFLRITKIPATMDDDGVDRINVTGVGRVSLTADMHVSIKAEQKAAFHEWLRDNGRADLLQENINPSTLKAAVKGMFKNGEEIPEALLNVSPFTRASITKS
jgi:hypothetical protein